MTVTVKDRLHNIDNIIASLTPAELDDARALYASGVEGTDAAYWARQYTLHPELRENGPAPKTRLIRVGRIGSVNFLNPFPPRKLKALARKMNRLEKKNPEKYARKIHNLDVVLRLGYIRGDIELEATA